MGLATAHRGRASAPLLQREPGSRALLDSEAFTRLYEETVDAVYRYSWMLVRDACVAEDICAEVYLRAWRARASFRGDGRALSWVLSIAHNCALSLFRGGRTVEADLSTLSETPDTSDRPEDLLVAAADSRRLQEAIHELTDEQQQVIFLRFFEGLPHDRVAERIGRNANAVRALQFRALHHLRKSLEASRG